MDVAAVVHVTTWLSSLQHQGALTADPLEFLKDIANEGLVTNQVFWESQSGLEIACDSSVDETQYEEDFWVCSFVKDKPLRLSVRLTGWLSGLSFINEQKTI